MLQHYGGQASALVQAAGRSALQLVHLVTAHFPGFRDHAVYNGQQVSIQHAMMGQCMTRHVLMETSFCAFPPLFDDLDGMPSLSLCAA